MIRTRGTPEFGTWHVPGRSPLIEYSTALLGFLAASARERSAGPYSQNAVGGVLFGTCEQDEIRVLAHRSVECQGDPDALFVGAGEQQVEHLLESYTTDPELKGLVPVGWYRSRVKTGIQMSPEDLRIWNRYFPLPWQVTLVLRVQEDDSVKAGFFFRPDRGPVRTESSYRVFEVEPSLEIARDVERLAEAVAQRRNMRDVGAAAPAPGTTAPGGGEIEPPPALLTPPAPGFSYMRLVWPATALLAMAALVTAAWMWQRLPAQRANPVRDVALQFSGPASQLQLTWNPNAALVHEARSARLDLIDGGKPLSALTVSGEALQSGHWPVANESGSVEAFVTFEYPPPRPPLSVMAQFAGPPANVDSALATALTPLRTEVDNLQAALSSQSLANRELELRIRRIREQFRLNEEAGIPAARVPAPKPQQTPLQQAVPAPQPPQPQKDVAAAAPAAGKPPAAAPAPQQAAPQQAAAPQPGGAAPQQAPFTDRVPAQAPATSLPPPPQPPAYSGPTAGKVIWTGYLAAGGTITIDGRATSTGTVNSALPGVPVRVWAYPGEFSSGGVTLFSSNPRHQSGAVTESRSAQNGWLATRYVYDAGRAREVQLTSVPGAAGSWRQMQLRAGEKPLSVVVIEWEIAR